MELPLSLGDASQSLPPPPPTTSPRLDFCMALGLGVRGQRSSALESGEPAKERSRDGCRGSSYSSSFLQLDPLPFTPIPRNCNGGRGSNRPSNGSSHFRLPWLVERLGSEPELLSGRAKHLDVNRSPDAIEDTDDVAAQSSSPNSAASSFPTDFGITISGRGSGRTETEIDAERDCSRGSDEDENGPTRKKLRLSKEQSAFLEESFKEHSTLNPKQKIALARQLNLRPRQVEVWFQNRRARTKLKQTEIDCQHLKRCCETLTEENRRLQKELKDLRALKTSPPFYMQPPATTLTMCPSCDRSSIPATSPAAVPMQKPRVPPFCGSQPGQGHGHQEHYSSGP